MAHPAPPKTEKTLLVLCNTPDCKTATGIGENLIAARAAACVNILPACRSLYRWQGEVALDEEVPLLIKTTAAQMDAVRRLITAAHPYDMPEIIAVPIQDGLPAYLNWIAEECTP